MSSLYGKEAVLQKILETKLIPVFYHADADVCKSVVKACYEGGIRVFEFTNRGEKAFANFEILRDFAHQQFPDMLLGIGTVKDAATAGQYIAAKAAFIVSPLMQPAIAPLCFEKDLLWIPGCMTPTEIDLAERSGASLVKLFPGNLLGPDFVKAIKEIFPRMLFMPTGGVEPTAGNIMQWLDAGAVAMGMGSKLITKDMLATGNFRKLREEVSLVMGIIESAGSSFRPGC